MSLYDSEPIFKNTINEILKKINNGYGGDMCKRIALRFEDASLKDIAFTSSIETGAWAANPNGTIHGGIIAAILDQSMGVLSTCLTGGKITPTISMNISYAKPVPLDKRIFIKSHMISGSVTMFNMSCEAWVEGKSETTIASATGIYHIPKNKPSIIASFNK
ncbi:MAG: PaaI family thioesterase [Lachnospiraceae bacterium]|nr:PaaI family thioesterase [Lachnospiraceae bacterium]